MSVRIYSTTYTEPIHGGLPAALLSLLPPELVAKAERFRQWQDAYGCIFGRLLLALAFEEQGLPALLDRLLSTAYGRPYLPDAPDFNISHSSHRVACAITEKGR